VSAQPTWVLAMAAAILPLVGCAGKEASAARAGAPTQHSWRSMVTEDDAVRLSQWRQAWTRALIQARNAGAGTSIAAEGLLLEPDSALALQQPPAGVYRCRTIKIGAQSTGMLNYVTYPVFNCRISAENGALRFTKLGGSQRPIGTLLPQTDKRMVFLGTLQLGDETNTLAYGRDRERDMAGLLESIGDRRWRLVLPYPHFESLIDIIELVPAGINAK